ncbi:UbiA family prenyltransferase [Duganella violaceipulchra]|uniref:4-hydroxybenzoate polyprenyltransferase n=1 Tax=Duganella violaceipulchra TaxID=2849652 RepID=A0AA41L3P0_9BURK|nr:UbiA family prenyltransferase [Duganella violaceicalia]MBV6319977.1 UbiA family prenyltransferase [Duganella violaceicalia]MCP2010342.1 4-hydroxybenzoate polyprenyltransferase [Duganella violaceicalia]
MTIDLSQAQEVNDSAQANTAAACPLVVDLDGTLTPTDTLLESVIQLVKQSPLNLLRLPFWLLKGRAAFKETVSSHTRISAAHLPYREAFLAYLYGEKNKGRRIILATAAHRSIAHDVADHLALFDEVLATDMGCNLKGNTKLAAIQQKVGAEFVYAGDSRADIPIWNAAQAAVLVGASAGLSKSVRRRNSVEQEFPREAVGFSTWLKALRVHQWLKNLLLFVPLLTAFSFMDSARLATTAIACLSFSLAASATYVVNDLWDLESDRAHPRKKHRPLASARIPILAGLAVAGGLLLLAVALALVVSQPFFFMLLLYVVLTSTYSWLFKEYVLIDVIMLSILYTLRILAGSVAIAVVTSAWLLAFSVFMFLSLALVKRCSELISLEQIGKAAACGRDYRVTDLAVLSPLGLASAMSAVVVFGLFINSPDTQARYATPDLLWLVALGLIYWLARLWIKTARGEMHDDPVIYAIKDRGSRSAIIVMGVTMLIAHFFGLN